MRVQLVAQQSEEQVLESLRPEETDLDELDYSSPDDSSIGNIAGPAMPEPPRKNKMTFSGGPAGEEPKMNREERRRMEKAQPKGRK
ncbi:hypothetical protein D3C86_1868900 [compost metagenome]